MEVSNNKVLKIINVKAGNSINITGTLNTTVITNLTSDNGSVTISGNTGCTYSNVTAPNGKVNITDCKLI